MKTLSFSILIIFYFLSANGQEITIEVPSSAPQFGIAEYVIKVSNPSFGNPFTDVDISGKFTSGNTTVYVSGFCDSDDGSVFRVRYSPEFSKKSYDYHISFSSGNIKKEFTGKLKSIEPSGKGPVIADPANPKHFIFAGTNEPFYHMGYTAYGLVDPANDDSQVEATIRYCRGNGFNKIRFLLSGYPRDFDNRSSNDVEHGVPADPWKSLNYGSLPGRVNPLPTWIGAAHKYDFTRFNVSFWQRVDRAVRLMNENGIIATCIFQIEKQDLPKELGILTANEYRLYKYGISRLAAFSNVWWDLGNEHNEFRKPAWGNTMGDFVKANDPFKRLASAHAYAEFFYNDSKWADFIITQQYGSLDSVHNWTLKYNNVPKPYVNEEYGYEGNTEKPVGHGMNRDWVRKCHWAIAMAGGYATYGDWSDGVSYFYMGIPGNGQAVTDLKNLRSFFESIPFSLMKPADNLTTAGYCLSIPGKTWVIYLPDGGTAEIDLKDADNKQITGRWYDPVRGEWHSSASLKKGKNYVTAPSAGKDWVLLVSIASSPKEKNVRKSLVIASVQMRSSDILQENVQRISEFIMKCAADGARVVVFPECALSGYYEKAIKNLTENQIREAEKQVATACSEAGVYAIVGLPWRQEGKLYNSASVINPDGTVIERYHKIQLAESWPDEGDHLSVFSIDSIPCSIIICHDERYPELVRLPVLAGAKVIFYISHESGIKEQRKIVPYRAQIQARAVENNVFVIQSNAPANADSTGSNGHSRIIAPDGNIISEAQVFSEDVLMAEIDPSKAGRGNALNSINRGILRDWWKEGMGKVKIIE